MAKKDAASKRLAKDPAPTPSNIPDRPDVENPDVGPFIAYIDAWYWLAERISLRESLPIDEAASRAEKTIRYICMNTPEKLTMWGFRKADQDAELKPVTPQAWQGHTPAARPTQPRKRAPRRQPLRERARRALEELYPNDVPDQTSKSHGELAKEVNAQIEKRGQKAVSYDTILRAAGRRK
jgi:hypothetical protein